MRKLLLASVALIGFAAAPAFAQQATSEPGAWSPGRAGEVPIGEVQERSNTRGDSPISTQDNVDAPEGPQFFSWNEEGAISGGYQRDELVGSTVVDEEGAQLGEVEDIVGSQAGTADHVVIQLTNDEHLVVPISTLERAQGGEGDWMLNHSQAELEAMPRYHLQGGQGAAQQQ